MRHTADHQPGEDMGLIEQVLRGTVKQLAPPLPGSGWGTRWSTRLPSERDYSSLVGDGMENSIVGAVVMWIARQFPKAPVMLEKRDARGVYQPVPSHPLLSVLARPNPWYSGVLLEWAVIVSFLTDGNAYKMKQRNDSGRMVGEVYIPHWMIEPKWPSDGSEYLSHYQYSPGIGTYKIDPKDVVHYRYGLDPANTRKGRSPLKSLLREVYTDEEAARFTSSLLYNLGMPGVIISPGGTTTVEPAEAEAVKAKYQQEFGGDKRGMAMVMTGPTTLDTVGFNPQELDLGRLREIPEERVTSVLGVPAAVVGLGTGLQQTKVGATMAEMREMGWQDGIVPLHYLMADEIEGQELSEYEADLEPWRVSYNYSEVPELQESQDEKAKRWVELVGGPIASRAEGRAAFDLPVAPGDDVYLQPISLLEVPTKQRGGAKGLKASQADVRFLRDLDRIANRHQDAMAGDLEPIFERMGERAQVAYVASPKQITPDDVALVTNILSRMRVEEFEAEIGAVYTRYTELTAEATYGAVSSRIGVAVEWDIADPLAQQVLASGGTRLGLLDLTEDTRQAIYRAIEESRAAGEGPISLARRIRNEVPAGPFRHAGSAYRAKLIARTETLHAQRSATIAAGRKAGFDQFVIFDARLGPTDEECEVLDQRVVGFAEAQALVGSEHPNGTRSFSPLPRSGVRARFGEPGIHPTTHGLNGDLKGDAPGGVRCSGCGAKIAEAAGPGTVIACRKCKTVNEIAVTVEE